MTENVLPAYRDLKTALEKTTLKLHPSQAHGLLCGILCGDKTLTAAWEEFITGTESSPKAHSLLTELYEGSVKQLQEFTFEFQLLLPTDKASLALRAEALTLWAQGFLTGLKIMQIPILDRTPSESTEAIGDIIEIAKMNFEYVSDSEEDEQAYAELVEYIKVSVILIYHDMHDDKTTMTTQQATKQLH